MTYITGDYWELRYKCTVQTGHSTNQGCKTCLTILEWAAHTCNSSLVTTLVRACWVSNQNWQPCYTRQRVMQQVSAKMVYRETLQECPNHYKCGVKLHTNRSYGKQNHPPHTPSTPPKAHMALNTTCHYLRSPTWSAYQIGAFVPTCSLQQGKKKKKS